MSWHVDFRMRLGTLDLAIDLEGSRSPLAVIGPNGSGKTTLLRTVAGAHRPEEGRIRIADTWLFDSDRAIDLPPERRRIGYVPQGYGLFPHLDVLDNVAFGWIAESGGPARAQRRREAAALLERMSCGHLAGRSVAELSGGEQQRVALARALATRPALLLLDEPLAALDAAARRAMRRYVADHLVEHGGPAIVVSHDARDVEALGGELCVLEAGRIVQRGAAADVAQCPATEFVEAFFEGT